MEPKRLTDGAPQDGTPILIWWVDRWCAGEYFVDHTGHGEFYVEDTRSIDQDSWWLPQPLPPI